MGIPLEQTIWIEVALSKGGKCEFYTAFLYKTYLGGGKYASPKLSSYFAGKEIKCDNIFK